MRIAFILRSEFGLLGTSATYMLPSRVARHHDVLVLTSPTGKAERDLKVFSDPGLAITPLRGTTLPKRLNEAMGHLERFRPDIVHIFYFRDALLYAQAVKTRLASPGKWLLDVRTPLLEENRWRRLGIQARNLLHQRYIDWAICPSNGCVRSHFPYLGCPITPTSLGVALDRFVVEETWPCENISRFVYVGSVARRRRIDQLVRWFGAFAAQAGGGVSLDIFGGGNTLKNVRAQIAHDGLADIITAHGPADQELLFRRLPTFDAGIGYVPDGHYDDAPALKILEYAAAGLPIAASGLRGLRGMAREGLDMSFFANAQDDFVKCLMELRQRGADPELLRQNRAVVARWDWDRVIERDLLPVYGRLVGVAA